MLTRRSERLSSKATSAPAFTSNEVEDRGHEESDYQESDGEGGYDEPEYAPSSQGRPKVSYSARRQVRYEIDWAFSSPRPAPKHHDRSYRCTLGDMPSGEPIELVSLSQTSRFLQNLLLDSRHLFIYKTVRENASGLPPPQPPIGMSEMSWARLLYGGNGCNTCNRHVPHIDFGLRRRVCVGCRRSYQFWESRFKSSCPGMDAYMMNLVGFSRIGVSSRGHASENQRFYWKPDLDDMDARIARLERREGTRAADEFYERRVALVEAAMQEIPALSAWEKKWIERKSEDQGVAEMRRYEEIVSRAVAAGYDRRDIPSRWGIDWAVSGKPELTDTAWKRLLPRLQKAIAETRESRLKEERKACILKRCSTATELYRKFLHTLTPIQWRYLPTPNHILYTSCSGLACFRDLLAMQDEPSEQQWAAAAEQLPKEMSTHLSSYISAMDGGDSPQHCSSTTSELLLMSAGSDAATLDQLCERFSSLDYARTVLVRPGQLRSGCDVWHAWYRWGDDFQTFKRGFSSQGSDALSAIAALLRKDVNTVTATELDVSSGDVSFRCAHCPGTHVGWRSWVDHCIRSPNSEHNPILVALDPDQAVHDSAKDAGHEQWACAHCDHYCVRLDGYDYENRPIYRADFGSYPELEEHKATHGIPCPSEFYDISYYIGFHGKARPATTVSTGAA
ncbi:unnamed protein product [Peniophora sp. CBMAI 1063]|nr:unnamed protein product [Peniophora sp. CBMAI 1063]